MEGCIDRVKSAVEFKIDDFMIIDSLNSVSIKQRKVVDLTAGGAHSMVIIST